MVKTTASANPANKLPNSKLSAALKANIARRKIVQQKTTSSAKSAAHSTANLAATANSGNSKG